MSGLFECMDCYPLLCRCGGRVDPDVPNPGTKGATRAGCTCPVLDNAHGRGAFVSDGQPQFWMTEGCPVHAAAPTPNPSEKP